MVRQALNDGWSALERRRESDEDALCARGDQSVDEGLREAHVDLPGSPRRPLGTVASRVVEVGVESVLMGDVPDPAEARSEVAAVTPAEISNADPRRARVLGRKLADDTENHAHEAIAPPPAPGTVGSLISDRVPAEEIPTFGREPNSADEPAARRGAERQGSTPLDRLRDERSDGVAPRPCARSGGHFGSSGVSPRESDSDDGKHDVHARSTAARAVRVQVVALLGLALVAGAACRESSPADAPSSPGAGARSTKVAPHVPARRGARVEHLLGRSHLGRPIKVIQIRRFARAASGNRVLVVGCIHGTECAGVAVVEELLERRHAASAGFWLLPNANPDGLARDHRQNARGVDLNRNFPSQWRALGARWDSQYAGPRPRSERETRILTRVIEQIRPETTIWYHQYGGREEFVRAWGLSVPAARRYARLARIRFRRMPWPNGTAPNWQNHRFPGTSSFVVEFPQGPLSRAAVRRHAATVVHLARG